MIKIIMPLKLMLLCTVVTYAQSTQLIYQNPALVPNVQSIQVQTFNFSHGQPKQIFYQAGIGGFEGSPCMSQPEHHNTFRFNQFSYTSVIPYNGFLNRRGCENVFGSCFWYVIRNYSISHNDQNFLIAHHRYSNLLACSDTLFETNVSYNGGLTSFPIFPGIKFLGMDIDPVDDNVVYLASSNTVYKSVNRGQNFQVMSDDHTITGFIRVNPQNNSVLFLRVNGGMKVSTNAGAGFTNLSVPEFTEMVFRGSNEVFASSLTGVFKSTNQGINWSQISGIQNINTIELDPDNENTIYIGTDLGIYRSVTGGLTFNSSAQFFQPDGRVFKISKDPGSLDTLYVVSNMGIYKVWDLLVNTAPITSEIPEKFSLHQNYPNPFNPETNIKIDLPDISIIQLIVYDIQGREVSQIYNGELITGEYSFIWDASGLPSGIYFIRFTAESSGKNFTNTIKTLLTK